jgi:hypothetical protein
MKAQQKIDECTATLIKYFKDNASSEQPNFDIIKDNSDAIHQVLTAEDGQVIAQRLKAFIDTDFTVVYRVPQVFESNYAKVKAIEHLLLQAAPRTYKAFPAIVKAQIFRWAQFQDSPDLAEMLLSSSSKEAIIDLINAKDTAEKEIFVMCFDYMVKQGYQGELFGVVFKHFPYDQLASINNPYIVSYLVIVAAHRPALNKHISYILKSFTPKELGYIVKDLHMQSPSIENPNVRENLCNIIISHTTPECIQADWEGGFNHYLIPLVIPKDRIDLITSLLDVVVQKKDETTLKSMIRRHDVENNINLLKTTLACFVCCNKERAIKDSALLCGSYSADSPILAFLQDFAKPDSDARKEIEHMASLLVEGVASGELMDMIKGSASIAYDSLTQGKLTANVVAEIIAQYLDPSFSKATHTVGSYNTTPALKEPKEHKSNGKPVPATLATMPAENMSAAAHQKLEEQRALISPLPSSKLGTSFADRIAKYDIGLEKSASPEYYHALLSQAIGPKEKQSSTKWATRVGSESTSSSSKGRAHE